MKTSSSKIGARWEGYVTLPLNFEVLFWRVVATCSLQSGRDLRNSLYLQFRCYNHWIIAISDGFEQTREKCINMTKLEANNAVSPPLGISTARGSSFAASSETLSDNVYVSGCSMLNSPSSSWLGSISTVKLFPVAVYVKDEKSCGALKRTTGLQQENWRQ